MTDATGKNLSREDRLAAKLRENLRRRKAQGRALDADSPSGLADKELSKGDSES